MYSIAKRHVKFGTNYLLICNDGFCRVDAERMSQLDKENELDVEAQSLITPDDVQQNARDQ